MSAGYQALIIIVIVIIMKNPWYASHVDTGSVFIEGDCSENVVTNLMKGLCHGGSHEDMRNCTSFSDTSYFEDLDDYFAANGLETDMVHGAELFNHAHNLIITILAFASLTIATCVFADVALPKDYHRAIRIFLAVLAGLSLGFTLLMMFLGNDKNELLNYDAWMILYCYDQYVAKESFNNSIIADFAYVVCILLMVLEFGSISLLLTPGNCCLCCDCTSLPCCSCMRGTAEDFYKGGVASSQPVVAQGFHYAPVSAYEPTAPLLDNEYPQQGQYQPQHQPKVMVYQPSNNA